LIDSSLSSGTWRKDIAVRRALFITHPEVQIDPHRPVPRWHLSPRGIERMRILAGSTEVQDVSAIWSSRETKAIEAAGILAASLGLGVSVDPGFNEIDRSATGYLPAAEHEELADAFFAKPAESVRGWERAVDVQERGLAAFNAVLASEAAGDVAVVAHGGIGTLLFCGLSGLPIDRVHDQPFQGHYWSFSIDDRAVLHPWRPIAER
jgi:broad specificity phosphatase PhoE